MFIEKQLEKNGKKSYNKDKEMKRFQKRNSQDFGSILGFIWE